MVSIHIIWILLIIAAVAFTFAIIFYALGESNGFCRGHNSGFKTGLSCEYKKEYLKEKEKKNG